MLLSPTITVAPLLCRITALFSRFIAKNLQIHTDTVYQKNTNRFMSQQQTPFFSSINQPFAGLTSMPSPWYKSVVMAVTS